MFDWEEEELTNMIWGDDAETGDHIVPFKVRSEQLNKKEQIEESKTAEQKITGTKIDLHDKNLGSSSSHNVDEGLPQPDFCMSSWPDTSLTNATKVDQDLSATELSKCLAEPVRYDSTREKTSELGKGPDIFHSSDESKEQGDFDDYSWANIGSFDDLDRMFSDGFAAMMSLYLVMAVSAVVMSYGHLLKMYPIAQNHYHQCWTLKI